MKVTLISHTQDAENLLIFTKATRLTLSPGLLDQIRSASHEDKMRELEYMANTIPSSWEFVDYVFLVEGVSRAYTHQQVRTRAASYAQQTMRVLDMGKYDYVYTDGNRANPEAMEVIESVNTIIQDAYRHLLSLGQAVEDARGILPTNISTNIVCKFNLRTFVDLAKARTGGRTQSEYQKVVNAMVDEVLRVHPWAEKFLFQQGRDYFAEIEAFAQREYGGNLLKKGELLKIVDKMRKEVAK
ncbi:MAG: FAD-dependent thymidylate synthase [Desulfurellales bacterium]|nr:MAG: FAD-dependent thymidylate synthase [Desulfurellales bacterium]